MQSLWNDDDARAHGDDPLALRVYSSQLLGREPSLVLHGGGNTSLKADVTTFYGTQERVLYVKGSGWDLATITPEGFAPVRLSALLYMATLPHLSDSDMVREQRAACLLPDAPAPSVEAILHALIPYDYVDHTHADAVVSISNTPDGEAHLRALYGERVLVFPYVMPGFVLARDVYERTQGIAWDEVDAIVLLHHGVFTFANTARASYERMIEIVTKAENFLKAQGAWDAQASAPTPSADALIVARLRRHASQTANRPLLARLHDDEARAGFACLPNMPTIATQGCLTPDHIIRTKRVPLVLGAEDTPEDAVRAYAEAYRATFAQYASTQTMLDPAPRWAVWAGHGTLSLAENAKGLGIVDDITRHTIRAIQWAEALGGWRALPVRDLFEMEYWELEQAKLKKGGVRPPFEGKVALVTGAASGIGKACVQALQGAGCAVIALDLSEGVRAMTRHDTLGLVCDVTDVQAVQTAIEAGVRHFGGLDLLISNAGIFPPSMTLEAMQAGTWDASLSVNVTAHQRLLQACIPYLREGLSPAVVFVASKNVPAPGKGAGAYSVAKAALTQLARVAALELAPLGVRVNVVHPDAVFDTAIWTDDVLAKRAESYGLSVEQYKTKNLLGVSITSADVARTVLALLGDAFRCTTGAQVPIDGGNDRVL
mgnify:CR=1 FL=1